jgi:hypothetical protein
VAEWRNDLEAVLRDPDPRVSGRVVAERYSADRMAERVLVAWQGLVDGQSSGSVRDAPLGQ